MLTRIVQLMVVLSVRNLKQILVIESLSVDDWTWNKLHYNTKQKKIKKNKEVVQMMASFIQGTKLFKETKPHARSNCPCGKILFYIIVGFFCGISMFLHQYQEPPPTGLRYRFDQPSALLLWISPGHVSSRGITSRLPLIRQSWKLSVSSGIAWIGGNLDLAEPLPYR